MTLTVLVLHAKFIDNVERKRLASKTGGRSGFASTISAETSTVKAE